MTKRSGPHLHHLGYAAKVIEPFPEQHALRVGFEICTNGPRTSSGSCGAVLSLPVNTGGLR
jgi:hypothetical protein